MWAKTFATCGTSTCARQIELGFSPVQGGSKRLPARWAAGESEQR